MEQMNNDNRIDAAEQEQPVYAFPNMKKSIAWLSFLAFFSVLNETVFNVSLPDIAHDFSITPSVANWINTCFMITFALGSIIYGTLSSQYGIKKPLLIGVLIYGSGSLLGFFAHDYLSAVLAARLIQGAGASAVPGLIMVMVTRYVGEQHRGKAFGMIGSMVALGEGIGPVVGGVLADYVHWSYLFIIPVMTIVSLPFFLTALPQEPSRNGRTDIIGIALLSSGIILFTLFTTTYVWFYLVCSMILVLGFALHIRRIREPFIAPSLFANRPFVLGTLAGSILLGTVAGFISMVPYFMRDVHQLSTAVIGSAIIFPGTLSVILFGILGGTLVDKKGTSFVFVAGLGLVTFSFVTLLAWGNDSPWLMTFALVLVFGGLSFIKTVISASVAESLAPDQAGEGMSMLSFACFMAEGIGIAVVGGLLTHGWLLTLLTPTVAVANEASFPLYSGLIILLIAVLACGGIVYSLSLRRHSTASHD
ncbi:mfs transporter [Paenibacillus alvei TS-15]|uniref:Mfs transporter n=2 Tax=Paenibacillus alvei TaxID=44250 RepID=S9U7G8_PAEAL|nr:mfs transporter [Paenibacillus alvei TS-15]